MRKAPADKTFICPKCKQKVTGRVRGDSDLLRFHAIKPEGNSGFFHDLMKEGYAWGLTGGYWSKFDGMMLFAKEKPFKGEMCSQCFKNLMNHEREHPFYEGKGLLVLYYMFGGYGPCEFAMDKINHPAMWEATWSWKHQSRYLKYAKEYSRKKQLEEGIPLEIIEENDRCNTNVQASSEKYCKKQLLRIKADIEKATS